MDGNSNGGILSVREKEGKEGKKEGGKESLHLLGISTHSLQFLPKRASDRNTSKKGNCGQAVGSGHAEEKTFLHSKSLQSRSHPASMNRVQHKQKLVSQAGTLVAGTGCHICSPTPQAVVQKDRSPWVGPGK